MPAAGPSAVGPSRRLVLRGACGTAAGAALTSLAGCDIRLQDDAPTIPGLQRRSVPDEALLVDAVRRTQALSQLAGRVPSPSAAVSALGALHATQTTVLRGRLTDQGVPNHVIDPSGTPTTGTATAAVSAPATSTAADLLTEEQSLLAALLAGLPTASSANRAVVASVAAVSGAAVQLLGAEPTWPTADPLPTAAATTLLAAVRATGYAFQVVAAQSAGDQRAAALATHTELEADADTLAAAAGTSAPSAPLGYALPFPVTDPDTARRLAAQVLITLVAGGLTPLPDVAVGSTALVTLVRHLVAAQRWGRSWAVAAVPFPGLAYP